MCGIVGYIGTRNTTPILLDGLYNLEFRGYDSAGMFVCGAGHIKSIGPVAELSKKIKASFSGTQGIAHTRWATHGLVNEANTHPHYDCSHSLWLVHNGVIENHQQLRRILSAKGHSFTSDTDSEVLVHLIEEHLKGIDDIETALILSLRMVHGTYGIALMSEAHPDQLFAASMGSPIVIGIGNGEYIVASHNAAIVRHTRDVVYLHDGECAVLTKTNHRVFTLDHVFLDKAPSRIEGDIEEVQKDGYDHFMLKEIMEMPDVLVNSARGRILLDEGMVRLGGLELVRDRLSDVRRLIIVGCGSAYHAGLVGRCMLEEYAEIPVEVELGSEFRYRNMVLEEGTVVIAVSQSGETLDTLASIREARRKGLLTLGIVNDVGSVIARETDAGVYNHAGPEKGVASTKAFVSQLEVLVLFALFLGRQRGLSLSIGKKLVRELTMLPEKIRSILNARERIAEIARQFVSAKGFLYIGRKYNLPIAYEGALKLKEVSYIPAEGYGAGEMKHGPIALIDEEEVFAAVAVAPQDSVYEKMLSNIEEIRTRKGTVVAIVSEGDTEISRLAQHVIEVPKTLEPFYPMLTVVPLQLFAYFVGTAKGIDVDKPRHLAKSVTVE